MYSIAFPSANEHEHDPYCVVSSTGEKPGKTTAVSCLVWDCQRQQHCLQDRFKALEHWPSNDREKNYQANFEDTWRLFFIQWWYVGPASDKNQALCGSLYEIIICSGLSVIAMEQD